MKRVNVALIGVSGFALLHYREILKWHANGYVRLVAATIINQSDEREKCECLRQNSCEIFDDYRDMLARWDQKIDLCVIPTGIHLHAKMAVAAISAGCNVLLEKPVAATIQEVAEIETAAAQSGKFVAIGYQHIYTPEVVKMKKIILDGQIGEIECIKCAGVWPRPKSYYNRNNWAGRLTANSTWVLDAPFNNAFAHWLNLLCFFAGSHLRESERPQSIRAELYRAYEIESADTASLDINTINDIQLLLWVTHSAMSCTDPILEIKGSKGSLVWGWQNVFLRNKENESLFMPTCNSDQAREWMYRSIIDKLHGEDAFLCDLSIARNQTICANGAFAASKIHLIDSQYLTSKEETNGDFQLAIQDIKESCRNAFFQEKLWSEMGIAWACEPGNANLENFTEFQGNAV